MTQKKPIRCEFDRKKLSDLNHVVHMSNFVVNELRKAGVPIICGLFLRGVHHGKLEMFNEGPNAVYQWTPGDDEEDEEL